MRPEFAQAMGEQKEVATCRANRVGPVKFPKRRLEIYNYSHMIMCWAIFEWLLTTSYWISLYVGVFS